MLQRFNKIPLQRLGVVLAFTASIGMMFYWSLSTIRSLQQKNDAALQQISIASFELASLKERNQELELQLIKFDCSRQNNQVSIN